LYITSHVFLHPRACPCLHRRSLLLNTSELGSRSQSHVLPKSTPPATHKQRIVHVSEIKRETLIFRTTCTKLCQNEYTNITRRVPCLKVHFLSIEQVTGIHGNVTKEKAIHRACIKVDISILSFTKCTFMFQTNNTQFCIL